MILIFSLLAGFICGVVFALVKLPIPAPPVFSGIVGIIGIWLGYGVGAKLLEIIVKRWFQ